MPGVKIHASVVAGARQKASPSSPKLDIMNRLPSGEAEGSGGEQLYKALAGAQDSERGRERARRGGMMEIKVQARRVV